MKKWTTPEVATLEIKDTANGFFNWGIETPFNILSHDKKQEAPTTPAASDPK